MLEQILIAKVSNFGGICSGKHNVICLMIELLYAGGLTGRENSKDRDHGGDETEAAR